MKNLLFLVLGATIYSSVVAQSSVFDIARKGTLVDLQKLYEKFPDTINTTNDAGYSPLILACYHGNNDVAAFLAKNSKDINGNSNYGTPLMAAVVKKNEAMVAKLLELKADPNIADPNKTTALHYAVIFDLPEIAELLIKNGADVSKTDSNGFSPLYFAQLGKKNDLIELLTPKKQ